MLNNPVNTKRILLDERVEMKVVVNPLKESTIYCRPFEEDVHNVSAFTVNGQEFVHNYIADTDDQKYIVTNIITEDGDVHEDVMFKLVVVEKDVLPMSTINLKKTKDESLLKENASPAVNPVPAIALNEAVLVEKVKEYKKDLLTEFLTFSQVHQKYVVESIENLKKHIDICVESTLAEKANMSILKVEEINHAIANELNEKFTKHTLALEKFTESSQNTAMQMVETRIDECIQAITESVNERINECERSLKKQQQGTVQATLTKIHEQNTQFIKKAIKDAIKESDQPYDKISTLDKQVAKLIQENTSLKNSITQLNNERSSLKAIVESARTYTDAQVSRASRDAEYYARRILDLGSGGGSVAVQYVGGGTMYGDLDVRNNILSGGVNLTDVFAGEGGGDNNPINGGYY